MSTVNVYAGNKYCKSVDYLYTHSLCTEGSSIYVEIMNLEEIRYSRGTLIFLSILYFENLSRCQFRLDHPEFDGRYIFDRLSPEELEYIRAGKLRIIIDYAGEPAVLNQDVLIDFHREMSNLEILADFVGLITSNRAFSSAYENWCREQGFKPIRIFSYNHAIYHFSGTLRASPRIKTSSFSEFSRSADYRFNRKYVCLNNMPRVHRYFVLSWLKANNYLGQGFVSCLQGLDSQYIDDVWSDVHSLDAHNVIGRNDFQSILNSVPVVADASSETNRGELAGSPGSASIYAESFFSIVTESDFSRGEIVRITEKALKPITGRQPFLLWGNPNSVKLLIDEGFYVFEDVFDPSYDKIVDLTERSSALTALMKPAIKQNNSMWLQTLVDASDRLEHNYSLLLGKSRGGYETLSIHREIEAWSLSSPL